MWTHFGRTSHVTFFFHRLLSFSLLLSLCVRLMWGNRNYLKRIITIHMIKCLATKNEKTPNYSGNGCVIKTKYRLNEKYSTSPHAYAQSVLYFGLLLKWKAQGNTRHTEHWNEGKNVCCCRYWTTIFFVSHKIYMFISVKRKSIW